MASDTRTLLAESLRAAAPNGKRYVGVAAWIAVLWGAWLLLQAPYLLLRSQGDEVFRGRSVERLDEWLFFGHVPTRALQSALFEGRASWLSEIAFTLHGVWFGIPFAFGLVLLIYQRERFMEYVVWQYVLLYISAITFVLFPVRPPWMEPGIVRILEVQDAGYIGLDNNPLAAMPSLHAGLPALTCLFFFLRCKPSLRFFGAIVGVFCVLVSAAVVYLGEHWAVDVLGGWLFSALAAWLCMSVGPRALYARIPGRPVQRLIEINARICGRPPSVEPPEQADHLALPRAA